MCKHDHDCNMNRNRETKPFPHTEVKTTRGDDVERCELVDDLLNWLAWEFVDREKWAWVFRGTRKDSYRLESTLERKLNDRAPSPGVPDCSAKNAEEYLLSRFKKAARHFPER